MQKQRRQPSGLAPDRWKNPALHSSHRAPATLFCTQSGNSVYRDPSACGLRVERRPRRANVCSNATTCFTLQLQGLLLELTTPLLSHVELSVGRKMSKTLARFATSEGKNEAYALTTGNTFSIRQERVTLVTRCTPETQRKHSVKSEVRSLLATFSSLTFRSVGPCSPACRRRTSADCQNPGNTCRKT